MQIFLSLVVQPRRLRRDPGCFETARKRRALGVEPIDELGIDVAYLEYRVTFLQYAAVTHIPFLDSAIDQRVYLLHAIGRVKGNDFAATCSRLHPLGKI